MFRHANKLEWGLLVAAVVVALTWFVLLCNRLKETLWAQ